MAQTNRLARLVKATSRLPKNLRSTLWNKAFGRVIPMTGNCRIHFRQVAQDQVVVYLANHRKVQNHIGQIHACAMALLAETATGFAAAMNVPDSSLLLLKQMHIDYKFPSQGAMTATAHLDTAQQQLLRENEHGELIIPVRVTDESGQAPIECLMHWAWIKKKVKTE